MVPIYQNELEVLKEQRHTVELEEECSGLATSELEVEFEKMVNKLSLLHLDAFQPENSHQSPLLHFPLNLRSSEFTFERSKYHKTGSIDDLRDFIFEYFLEEGSENALFNRSMQRIYDLIEKAIKAKILLDSSLFLNIGDLDDTRRQLSELTCCSTLQGDTLLHDLKKDFGTSEKQISEMRIFETLLVPCSSSNSTCSYQSFSSLNCSLSKGLLHCKWKSDVPYFVFTLTEDSGKVFIANPRKIESSADKALDYIYLFHSVVCKKKSSKSSENYAKEFVGRMKVSRSFIMNSNGSKLVENEFVLFGVTEDHSKQTQTSSSSAAKSKGLSKKVAEMFKPSPSFKDKSTLKTNEPCIRFDELLQEPVLSELCNFDGLDSKNDREYDFRPNLELAAIVVKDYQCNSQKRSPEGGWGLKFLERITLNNANTSSEPSSTSEAYNKKQSERNMNVIIPAGLHGGPSGNIGGPSTLTERWRSGGHCACGGWDIGCPLTVLCNSTPHSRPLPQEEQQEDTKSLDFLLEGVENGESLLKIVSINEEVYHIYFHPTLSALQSFSVGVAILHTRTPSLHPKC
ncbi:hypothetical protein J5N97_024430 [Dioscorea zingiberensis]|uniref:Uncharacterized protein n=1 Tax=Dioscorea zingiberensis TaxID=325984 RepID=A0A9D5C7A6_9LILI|nr:hypothetical protein J5N97_024430 [Dioscorea zingiberensis]